MILFFNDEQVIKRDINEKFNSFEYDSKNDLEKRIFSAKRKEKLLVSMKF
jgi:hypothetical protein